MTTKMPKTQPTPPKAGRDDPENSTGALKDIGGSRSDHWNGTILKQTLDALWTTHADPEEQRRRANAAYAGLVGIAPRDELEGMMAAQLIAAHNAAMECYRRGMISDQTLAGRRENLNNANKLSRTWATLLDALNKHRGKGHQKVRVEHVHIHSGAQAVVGVVETRGAGGGTESKEQPHAQQIADAPQPPLWRNDPPQDGVPVTRDEERPLPDARRKGDGRTKG